MPVKKNTRVRAPLITPLSRPTFWIRIDRAPPPVNNCTPCRCCCCSPPVLKSSRAETREAVDKTVEGASDPRAPHSFSHRCFYALSLSIILCPYSHACEMYCEVRKQRQAKSGLGNRDAKRQGKRCPQFGLIAPVRASPRLYRSFCLPAVLFVLACLWVHQSKAANKRKNRVWIF